VNRADLRFFEPANSFVQPMAFFRSRSRGAARLFERFAKPELQFARGFFGEGDRHDLRHLGAATFNDADDAVDELSCFSCARGGFDDEGVIERVGDEIAIVLVGQNARHGRPLSSMRSAISVFDLRLPRRS
jgi:hypothetical protein